MDIASLFAELHTLPTVPKVAQDLIQQFDNPTTSLESVARNIERDPVIAAKVLRLANSARFRGSRDASSVEDAAMRLGFNTLRTLVLASAMTGAFKVDTGFNLKKFWLRSFRVASIARALAKQSKLDPDAAFTCGMMHNIGELLIQTGAPDFARRLNRHPQREAAALAAEETLQLGFGYPEVGAELARRWQLPALIQNAIAYQNKPTQTPGDGQYARLVAQSIHVEESLEAHGLSDAAKQDLEGPLFEGVDLAKLFDALPAVLEADKAFGDLLN
ncbi:histidine kinase [Pseudomonas straminea]|uniref:HD-like signal output (HDOD) domain, no enzymatic activity n=1 Tax=Pseudomonas straminea TaxID=47882 RepID=A0A1I1UKH1_PSEOC|nr:HDOD domain-containing protein [Pseudomonas straminea]GLX14152.1 histidine kinase [Pseudomonas straminea]SFD70128.1 HD-like signal output (HDOD) domain, no enzymatic activity [Pseudomonas straminea]